MSFPTSYYLSLITSQYQSSPKFKQWMSYLIGVWEEIAYVPDLMNQAFDIDFAVGPQLDTLGVLIGLPRGIKTPISGLFFSWHDPEGSPLEAASLGWSYGSWRDPSEGSVVMTSLADDAYRQMLKMKILTNNWDGTIPGLYTAWNAIFAVDGLELDIIDNQDMTMEFIVTGSVIPAVVEYILQGSYLPMKPAGVKATYTFNEV